MSPVFRLALGLAAVDGLASAFVATLLLAFFVIGSGDQSAAISVAASDVLVVRKSALAGSMTVQLVARLEDEQHSVNAVITPVSGQSGLVQVTEARAMTDGGAVYWSDCESQSPTCRSQLLITKPKRTCSHFRISAADTTRSFSDNFPRSIVVEATLIPLVEATASKPIEMPVDGRSWLHIKLYCGSPLQLQLEQF